MNLIKLDTKEYPISEQEFRSRFPHTSFPSQISFTDFGYEVVFSTSEPAYDEQTEVVQEIAPEKTQKGNYEQRWEIRNKQKE